jgi:hypothetical protein
MTDTNAVEAIFQEAQRGAQDAAGGVLGAAESMFDSIGLMRHPLSPIGRMAVGFGAGAAVVWAVRPSISFDEDGQPRPSTWSSDDPNATSVPWYAIAAVPAVICGTMI